MTGEQYNITNYATRNGNNGTKQDEKDEKEHHVSSQR